MNFLWWPALIFRRLWAECWWIYTSDINPASVMSLGLFWNVFWCKELLSFTVSCYTTSNFIHFNESELYETITSLLVVSNLSFHPSWKSCYRKSKIFLTYFLWGMAGIGISSDRQISDGSSIFCNAAYLYASSNFPVNWRVIICQEKAMWICLFVVMW